MHFTNNGCVSARNRPAISLVHSASTLAVDVIPCCFPIIWPLSGNSVTNRSFQFALYDAFSDRAFGGSQAAVLTDTALIDTAQRQSLAREIGMPATAFVDDFGPDWIAVQFMSTVMELPMCGHGTICLLTHMLETERLKLDRDGQLEVELRLPKSSANVSLKMNRQNRYQVMLDVKPSEFIAPPSDINRLLTLLDLDSSALDDHLPPETASGDFVHLVVPLNSLATMRRIKPDFSGMVDFCNANGIETVVVFCRETMDDTNDIHVRDFCPAVGVSESAAAGTTNAALACYLMRHNLLALGQNPILLHAEQGIELNRPSSIKSIITHADNRIERLQVGGVATRVLDGQVYLDISQSKEY